MNKEDPCPMCANRVPIRKGLGFNDVRSGFENRYFCNKCPYSWNEETK